jgi:hypothetical protein
MIVDEKNLQAAPEVESIETGPETESTLLEREREAAAAILNEGLNAADFLPEVKITVAGHPMRGFTLASTAMMKQLKSPLIEGIPSDQIENIILETFMVVILQSMTFEEACVACKDRPALELLAWAEMEKIPASETREVISETIKALRTATETRVKSIAPGMKRKTPETPPSNT